MRLKEIKPGMVVHCKTENEANMLLAMSDSGVCPRIHCHCCVGSVPGSPSLDPAHSWMDLV